MIIIDTPEKRDALLQMFDNSNVPGSMVPFAALLRKDIKEAKIMDESLMRQYFEDDEQ